MSYKLVLFIGFFLHIFAVSSTSTLMFKSMRFYKYVLERTTEIN